MRQVFLVLFLVLASGIFAQGIDFSPSYRLSSEGVLEYRVEENWSPRPLTPAPRVRYPFDLSQNRQITAFGTSLSSRSTVVAATPSRLFLSENTGSDWREISVGPPLKEYDYFTAVAIHPENPEYLVGGTSFHAFFRTVDGGESWEDISVTADFIYQGAGFYQTIHGIAFDPRDSGFLFFTTGYDGILYRYEVETETPETIETPEELAEAFIHRIESHEDAGSNRLRLYGDRFFWELNLDSGEWTREEYDSGYEIEPTDEEIARRAAAADRNGIYINPHRASGNYLENNLNVIEENGMNSLVVDCKDDNGNITYDSQLEFHNAMGSVRNYFNIENLITQAHERDIYVIARIVVFKDRRLYLYNNNEYAIWDSVRDAPWGQFRRLLDEDTGEESWEQIDHWVDPFNPVVWDYNIAVAKELQELGVDEIQFDYIRCPSDGPTAQIDYRFQRENMSRTDALCSFLAKAREEITLPISTDVFGFNGWTPMEYLGQDISEIARYVDVISPMLYPSHFNATFLDELSFFDRAEELYRQGTLRSSRITRNRVLIRPYIQAFLIGRETQFEWDQIDRYLESQLVGTWNGDASGFTLWNASNNYYMVRNPITRPEEEE